MKLKLYKFSKGDHVLFVVTNETRLYRIRSIYKRLEFTEDGYNEDWDLRKEEAEELCLKGELKEITSLDDVDEVEENIVPEFMITPLSVFEFFTF